MTAPGHLEFRLREADRFFMRQGPVWSSLKRLTRRLADEGIDYAVMGALALVGHGYERLTVDVDVLITRAALERFRARMVGRGYVPAFPGAMKSYRDTETQVKIEFLLTGDYPGDGKPKPVAFPDPARARVDKDGIWLITLEKLIELKLASGMSASHRLKDLADVVELVVSQSLPRDFAATLDPSVRSEFIRLWEAAQSRPPE
jgi:hypothetical protein